MDLNVVAAGEAGQGLQTVNQIISKALFRMGFSVFSSKDYMSRIRGGHNFMRIRMADEEISSPREDIDVLIALNEESLDIHSGDVNEGGVILYDGEADKVDRSDFEIKNIPAGEIASEVNPRAANTVFLGALWRLLDLDTDCLQEVIKERFSDTGVQEDNLNLLERGGQEIKPEFQIEKPPADSSDKMMINGNQSIGLGAAMAGVQFYSAYPMTPSTGILNYLAYRQQELGIAVEQAEDEIAAINMALGASYAGVRAMTGTSGGGFSLMAEGYGLAGIMETPIVIAEVQRPGPATGLPTRTEQADLSFIINAHQGEFPLMVIAPRDPEEAFYETVRAFNLAEKYQIPVVLLSDQFLADSQRDVEEFDPEKVEIERHLVSGSKWPEDREYKRYEITENGISPRAYPGQLPGEVVLQDSDEHDERGFIVESAEKRKEMVDKRMEKLTQLKRSDVKEPDYYGPERPEYLLMGWGSTHGPLKEAQKRLLAEDVSIGLLSFSDVWPLPQAELEKNRCYNTVLVSIENNATGQFADLVNSETGLTVDNRVLKYDGRPFTGQEIYRRLKKEVIV
ncbi:2-oxoacid:acceptor oxidoreductase subunit alpha [Halarsenatibacter silvermanii]|uniref:2-oxoglutarate ferredoxin oxidoreductase subunit alpha n=1 Tax=Halarsenatibacter silvermanii TaxID=321763 RepID=A0A1G9LDM7_9FIRM|nr:2-oxoacid:acceptor oxidoreductase subunit alpha [Halarsenatibacter silvermanii]SDL60109.1 2-oxoglutarate ferredoxin oxidoreductase subunit alpha [Halarsenatibacter silvermanii]